jgi:YcaO-like protein with predicted kinase domain
MHTAHITGTLDHLESIDFLNGNDAHPSPTLSRGDMRHLMSETGVTRLASTTLLDRLGIPTYYCVRPSALDPCAIYSSGKGLDVYQASMSSIFESYERWAAECASYKGVATQQELFEIATKRPLTIISFAKMGSSPVEWAFGKDMLTKQPVAAPVDLVQFPSASPRLNTTTGLSAHVTSCDAIRNGYFECVERHYSANMKLQGLLRLPSEDFCERNRDIDLAFRVNEIELHAFLIPSPVCFVAYCFSYDHWLGLPQTHCSGFGASDSLDEALERALLEIVQGRAAYISGLRDDVSKYVRPKSDQLDSSEQFNWLEQLRSLHQVYGRQGSSKADKLRAVKFREIVIEMSKKANATRPTCFPLRTAQHFPAFRVIIPEFDDCL